MWKTHICLNFVLYVIFLIIIYPSYVQATTTAATQNGKCNSTTMEKALIDNNPALKPIFDKFTPRSMLQKIKEMKCSFYHGDVKVNSEGAKNKGLNEFVRTEDLDNLKMLKSIVGNVELELREYPDITKLSFFENLINISGTSQTPVNFSVMNSQITSLFPPMYGFGNGIRTIELINNTKLCYLENFDARGFSQYKISGNKNYAVCKQEGKVCDSVCNGCYGPGHFCINCRDAHYATFHSPHYYKTCTKCDPGCQICGGPGLSRPYCTYSQFKKLNGKCLSSPGCPNRTRQDYLNSDICIDCANWPKQPNTGGYPPVYNTITSGFSTCKLCNSQCAVGCSGNSSRDCSQCRNFKHFYEKNKFECVQNCPPQAPNATRENVCDGGNKARTIESMSVLITMAISAVVSKIVYW